MTKRNTNWDSNIEYWMVALGTAIGFGCIWRFPFILYKNGGAVFLIPYYLLVFAFGIPQMLLESSLGQYFRMSLTATYSQVSRKFQGIPMMSMFVTMCVSVYYIYIMSYCVLYLKGIFAGLPFLDAPEDQILHATREYYNNEILELTPKRGELGGINYPLSLAAIISWFIVYLVIRKGISTTGKIAIVTVSTPYLLLTIFLIRISFLPGFTQGLTYLIKPDFSKLFTFEIWKDAMVQVAFQLSLGQGIMPMFASFRKPKDKIILSTRW